MTDTIQDGFPGLQEQPEPITVQLHLLIDISTSMISRWPQTISGLNEYIDALRQDKSVNYLVTITEFGLENEVVDLYSDAQLDSIRKFDHVQFYPHGRGTALWGAVGISLRKINTTDPVLFVVITDGEDNSSHTYGSASVNTLIEERQKLGNYTFAYLGVAKEAWGQEAQVRAFAASHSNVAGVDYNAGTYQDLAGATVAYSASMSHNSMLRSAGDRSVSMSVNSLFHNDQPLIPAADSVVPVPCGPASWTVVDEEDK